VEQGFFFKCTVLRGFAQTRKTRTINIFRGDDPHLKTNVQYNLNAMKFFSTSGKKKHISWCQLKAEKNHM
jgi:hypothetical protein